MPVDQKSEIPPEALSEAGLKHILSCLDDGRRLIAAGKVQRWEVFKWAIAVNLALASASAVFRPGAGIFLLSAAVTTVIALSLIEHYHDLIERSRGTVFKLGERLDKVAVDVSKITGRPFEKTKRARDDRELMLLRFGIALSLLPALAAYFYP